jgi:hypothetical protein
MRRREFLRSMAVWGAGAGAKLLAATQETEASPADTRIRVLDADFDVRPFVKTMKDNGVIVVGRYYSRGIDPKCNYEGKMLTRPEADAILGEGLGLLTVFQFCNGAGSFDDSKKGETDAQWAVARANEVGQPKNTAIYFGVDYNPIPENEDCAAANAAMKNIRHYFDQVWSMITANGWRVGVYGPGKVCAKLKEWGRAEYFWLSASIGHWGHADFYNSGQWHLFQSKTDLPLYSPKKSQRVDTDITNPIGSDFGQWRRMGTTPHVDPPAATAVIAARRFIKVGTVYLERDAASGEMRQPKRLESMLDGVGGRSCTLVKTFDKGIAGINLQEGGGMDAYCRLDDLTASLATMPVIRHWPSCE